MQCLDKKGKMYSLRRGLQKTKVSLNSCTVHFLSGEKHCGFNTSIRVNDPNKLYYRHKQRDRSCHKLQCQPCNVQGQQPSVLAANNTMSSVHTAAAVFGLCLRCKMMDVYGDRVSRKHPSNFQLMMTFFPCQSFHFEY